MSADRWFEASIPVGIFVTQVFVFHIAQLTGVLDITVDLLLRRGVRAAMRAEDRREAPPTTVAAPAVVGGLQ